MTLALLKLLPLDIKIAKFENFHDIAVESDAKVYIDTITGKSSRIFWKLLSLCINSKVLALDFVFFLFLVSRNVNMVIHSLTNTLVFVAITQTFVPRLQDLVLDILVSLFSPQKKNNNK